jgi:hypothetical protein
MSGVHLKSRRAIVFCARMKKTLLVSLLCLPVLIASAAEPINPPQHSVPTALRQLSDSFAEVFEKAAPSVVVIEARQAPENPVSGAPNGLEFFFRGPNGVPYRVVPETGERPDTPPNIGSGFVFTPEGHIITNNHVVADATDIKVKLRDGRRFDAELIGADERSDVAVIKINAPDLRVAALGDSDAVRVGELAFAIGTPMELPDTFTSGIISAKGRTLALGGYYDEYLQTDTSINPGNSGGPLATSKAAWSVSTRSSAASIAESALPFPSTRRKSGRPAYDPRPREPSLASGFPSPVWRRIPSCGVFSPASIVASCCEASNPARPPSAAISSLVMSSPRSMASRLASPRIFNARFSVKKLASPWNSKSGARAALCGLACRQASNPINSCGPRSDLPSGKKQPPQLPE